MSQSYHSKCESSRQSLHIAAVPRQAALGRAISSTVKLPPSRRDGQCPGGGAGPEICETVESEPGPDATFDDVVKWAFLCEKWLKRHIRAWTLL